jgi:pimeloyl-ACP methyl ester carboxylesterase
LAIKSIHWHQRTLNISYEIVNPNAKYDLVILHGWGSNKALMKDTFGKELDTFRHIYVDLPGFGNSSSFCVMNSHDYAEIMSLFFEVVGIKKDMIMGHSFGGKVATLLEPDFLVLLSSAGILEPKSWKVWAKIYTFKLFKGLGLAFLREKFVASDAKKLEPHMYETFKKVINEDFEPIFRHYHKKCLILWGKNDTATHLSSGEKIHALIPNSQFHAYDSDHYFFLHFPKEIAKRIKTTYISYLKS